MVPQIQAAGTPEKNNVIPRRNMNRVSWGAYLD